MTVLPNINNSINIYTIEYLTDIYEISTLAGKDAAKAVDLIKDVEKLKKDSIDKNIKTMKSVIDFLIVKQKEIRNLPLRKTHNVIDFNKGDELIVRLHIHVKSLCAKKQNHQVVIPDKKKPIITKYISGRSYA